LCGSVIPTFDIQGYVFKLMFTITTLLVDRSLGNLGFYRIYFLLFASNPNTFVKEAYANTDHSHRKLPQEREEKVHYPLDLRSPPSRSPTPPSIPLCTWESSTTLVVQRLKLYSTQFVFGFDLLYCGLL
jgi:hypothetical protein